MSILIPAILESRLEEIRKKVDMVRRSVPLVQIDLCDGEFVPSKTYGGRGTPSSLRQLASLFGDDGLEWELDMMVRMNTVERMGFWHKRLYDIQPDRVVIHVTSVSDWKMFSRTMYKVPCVWGLAVTNKTPIKKIKSVMDRAPFSYLQIMGIDKVGYSGQSLSKRTEQTIRQLTREFPGTTISVDGGVKLENTAELIAAGASQLGVNSGLFKAENIGEQIYKFNNS